MGQRESNLRRSPTTSHKLCSTHGGEEGGGHKIKYPTVNASKDVARYFKKFHHSNSVSFNQLNP